MSMYHMIHGVNPLAEGLLFTLGYNSEQFGRFRDAFLVEVDGELRIQIFTRCGGGNRDDYEEVFEWAKDEPTYIRDFDDDYDCTYATIEFGIPATEEGRSLIGQISELPDDLRRRAITSSTFAERSKVALDAIKNS